MKFKVDKPFERWSEFLERWKQKVEEGGITDGNVEYYPIQRYNLEYSPAGARLTHCEVGLSVLFKDHLAVVQKLEDRVRKLESTIQRLEGLAEETYNKGYDDGRWVGYHELNQDFGVTEMPNG